MRTRYRPPEKYFARATLLLLLFTTHTPTHMRIVASVHWLNVHPSPQRKLGKQIAVKQIIKYWIRAPRLVINPGKIALID